MKAMILAAGRGERLRPITDTIPKPMVKVGDKELLVWHIQKLKAAGIDDILINSAYLSEKIVSFIGDGSRFGVHVTHSVEGESGLETAGGIIRALPFFRRENFLVVNGDTFIDADYRTFIRKLDDGIAGHLYLVPNPPHNQKGDFSLDENQNCHSGADYTFSGAAVYDSRCFEGYAVEKRPLKPFFDEWGNSGRLKGSLLEGRWFDVGTVQRLEDVCHYVAEHKL